MTERKMWLKEDPSPRMAAGPAEAAGGKTATTWKESCKLYTSVGAKSNMNKEDCNNLNYAWLLSPDTNTGAKKKELCEMKWYRKNKIEPNNAKCLKIEFTDSIKSTKCV